MSSSRRAYLLAIFTALLVLLTNGYFMTALGLGLTLFATVDFIEKIGKSIPVLEALLFIACLQWIAGPYIDYATEYRHYKYHMYVSEESYMDLVVPSLFLFAFPIYYVSRKINYAFVIRRIQQIKRPDLFAINLIIAGVFSPIMGAFVPASIGFVFFLASGIKYVGLLYLFYSNSKKKWIALYTIVVLQFLTSVERGVFHDLVLWLIFILLFISIFYELSFIKKFLFISLGFACMFILQTIKSEFRQAIWQQYSGNKSELFITLFFSKAESLLDGRQVNDPRMQIDEATSEVNNRLNQGWIISRIMSQIPARKPYLQGETVENAIYSSLVPRFFSESKASGGGGKLTYEKLTGFHLIGTSMGTGILGEAYGNYGVSGTYVFMFLWGLFLSLFIWFIFNKSALIYSLPLWLPIIFLQVIKAETDLFTVLNHLVKSSIFVFGVIYIIRHFLKIRL
jgi:hypothetical protein